MGGREARRCLSKIALTLLAALVFQLTVSAAAPEMPEQLVTYAGILDPPFLMLNDPTNASAGVYGVILSIMGGLEDALNADPILNATARWRVVLQQCSSVAAAAEAVISGQANITGIVLAEELFPQLAYSQPFTDLGFVMATRKDGAVADRTWFVLQPFTGASWAVFGAFVLMLTFVSYFRDACSPRGTRGYGVPLCPWRPGSAAQRVPDLFAQRKRERAEQRDARVAAREAARASARTKASSGAAGATAAAAAAGVDSYLRQRKPEGDGDTSQDDRDDGDRSGSDGGGRDTAPASTTAPAKPPAELMDVMFESLLWSIRIFYSSIPVALSSRILNIATSIALIQLMGAYGSGLSALELAAATTSPYLSLADVQRQSLRWGTLPLGVSRFNDNVAVGLRSMLPQVTTYNTTRELISSLCARDVDAIFQVDQTLRYMSAIDASSCALYVDESASVGRLPIGFAVPTAMKGSALLAAANRAAVSMRSSQAINFAYIDTLQTAAAAAGVVLSSSTTSSSSSGQVNIDNLRGALYICAGLLGAAWVIHLASFCFEPHSREACARSCSCWSRCLGAGCIAGRRTQEQRTSWGGRGAVTLVSRSGPSVKILSGKPAALDAAADNGRSSDASLGSAGGSTAGAVRTSVSNHEPPAAVVVRNPLSSSSSAASAAPLEVV